MKKFLLIYLFATLFFCSCDKVDTVTDSSDINQWVYSTMKSNYLWEAQLPELASTKTNMSPAYYFESYMRYRDNLSVAPSDDSYGDRFSKLKFTPYSSSSGASVSLSSATTNDFGFGYRLGMSADVVNYMQIIYVVPGSPAHRNGFFRGQKISQIGAAAIPVSTLSLYAELSKSQNTFTLDSPQQQSVALAKEVYQDNPVIFDSVYNTSPKTGYLMYNHFSTGTGEAFLRELDRVFLKFKSAGVRDLVLDMRYNGGGELSVAKYLASLIVRKELLGEIMIFKESKFSFGNPARFIAEYFLHPNTVGSCNIDAQRVCILTTKATASASELIMHSLKPYYGDNLVVIGETTRGKNLGTVEITNRRYNWTVVPITLRVYDRNKVSGYEKGIEPDTKMSELIGTINPSIGCIGDVENEKLLHQAMVALHPEAFPGLFQGSSNFSVSPSAPCASSAPNGNAPAETSKHTETSATPTTEVISVPDRGLTTTGLTTN